MSLLVPNWRCFQSITSDAEAASFSECCLFSLATLEVDCDSETKSFALTERQRPDAWRWAIVNARGLILQGGCASTQGEAKQIAEDALHFHASPKIAQPSRLLLTSV